MNRFFSLDVAESYAPRRAFARLDQTEPVNLDDADQALLAYEAVDADWQGFQGGALFDLNVPNEIIGWQLALWGKGSWSWRPPFLPDPDPFEDVPLFRIEISVRRGEGVLGKLRDLNDQWLEFAFDPWGEIEAQVFAGLAAPPVAARISTVRPADQQKGLEAAFGMEAFPDATGADIEQVIMHGVQPTRLAVFDIGQGSASAVLEACGHPMLYFDLGFGVYGNFHTRPSGPLRFCLCHRPPIILSHWDTDHWAGAQIDRRALGHAWIAPRQSIGPTHKSFAADILSNGGRLLIVGTGPRTISGLLGNGARLTLKRGTGPWTDRNSSGLVLTVEDPSSGRAWLLTGDAGYNHIPPPLPGNLGAVVVPHHGADMGAASTPPPRPPGGAYARLLYSFGPNNRHGKTAVRHPTPAAMTSHAAQGWAHGSWSPSTPGFTIAGGDILATAQHLAIHLAGGVVGWSGPPSALLPCPCGATCAAPQT